VLKHDLLHDHILYAAPTLYAVHEFFSLFHIT
jgi:hypothetical protein